MTVNGAGEFSPTGAGIKVGYAINPPIIVAILLTFLKFYHNALLRSAVSQSILASLRARRVGKEAVGLQTRLGSYRKPIPETREQ
jgi:hypothetical protein